MPEPGLLVKLNRYISGTDEIIAEEFESAIEIFTRVLKLFNVSNSQINALTQEVRAEDYSELRTDDWASDKLEDLDLPDVDIQKLTIPENSVMNGKTIKDIISPLKYKIYILILIKDENTIQNPDSKEKFNSGDTLVVFGNPLDIALFISDYSLIPQN